MCVCLSLSLYIYDIRNNMFFQSLSLPVRCLQLKMLALDFDSPDHLSQRFLIFGFLVCGLAVARFEVTQKIPSRTCNVTSPDLRNCRADWPSRLSREKRAASYQALQPPCKLAAHNLTSFGSKFLGRCLCFGGFHPLEIVS